MPETGELFWAIYRLPFAKPGRPAIYTLDCLLTVSSVGGIGEAP